MTNATISIAISQICRSGVAVLHLHPPMVSLSSSLYDMPGLAPRIDYILRSMRLSNKLLEKEYVKGRLKWLGMILSNNIKFPSLECWMTFCSLTIYNDNSPSIRLYTKPWLYRTRPFTELWEVFKDRLRRMWHADGGRLLIRTPGPVPFGTCICLNCCDQSYSQTYRDFFRLCTPNIPRYFLDFAGLA